MKEADQISNEPLRRILECFDNIDSSLTKLDEKIERLDEKIERIDEKVGRMDEKIERMDLRITTSIDRLDNRIDDLRKETLQKIHEVHVDLTNRIDELENRVDLCFAECKSIREDQKAMRMELIQRMVRNHEELTGFNAKIDDRVTNLETWRNSYNR